MLSENTEIELLADFIEGKSVYEAVPAVRIGENRYRLNASPGFAAGFASGDEVEVAPSEKMGYRILKRGGNVCVQLFLSTYSAADRTQIAEMVRAIGGWLDGGKDGTSVQLLIFTIPVRAGFAAIEGVMARISEKFAVVNWMYGNIYDIKDGVTPLNWWLTPRYSTDDSM